MRWLMACVPLVLLTPPLPAPPEAEADPFTQGQAIDLDRAIPANERGIVCLAHGKDGKIYGGTSGRAAHFFAFEPKSVKAQSLFRIPGEGLGLSYALSKNLPQAEATLRRAAAAPRIDPRVRQNLALVVGLQGRFAEAEAIARADLPPDEAATNVAYLRQMLAQQNGWRPQGKPDPGRPVVSAQGS